MRVIQTMIPEGKHDAVVRTLREEGVDFAMADETSSSTYSDIVYIPIESEDVEHVLQRLRDVGIERHGYMVVSEAEAIVSDRFEARAAADTEPTDRRISRDELRTKARNLSRSTTNYIVFTIVSAIVATAGLLEDSAAVVVGSMVIAPLIGPPMASCVGTVINDDDLFWEGIRSQALGIAVAIVSATVFALLYRLTIGPTVDLLLIQQIAERTNPGLLILVIAIGAGVAGALSLTSGVDEALVGVMIAVALMPPAAAAGLGIAYADPVIAVGASVIVLVNLLSINAAGLVTLWAKEYRPDHWYDLKRARRVTIERLAVFVLAILVLTSVLVASSFDTRQNTTFEEDVERVIEESVDAPVLDHEVAYDVDVISPEPSEVIVRVGEEPRAGTAETIRERIEAETGHEVEVVVVFERTERSGA